MGLVSTIDQTLTKASRVLDAVYREADRVFAEAQRKAREVFAASGERATEYGPAWLVMAEAVNSADAERWRACESALQQFKRHMAEIRTEGEKQQPSLTKPTDPFFGIPNADDEDNKPW